MSNRNLLSGTDYFGLLPNFAAQTDPVGGVSTSQTDSDTSQERLYRIEVRNSGSLIAEHIIAATDALKAINLIENEYGEPLEAEIVKVETDDGRYRQVLVPKHWHGYTFDARSVK